MGNEQSYHKERAAYYSQSWQKDKWGSTVEADRKRDYHLRKLRHLQQKEADRAAQRETQRQLAQQRERQNIVNANVFRAQSRNERYAERHQSSYPSSPSYRPRASERREEYMETIMGKFNTCYDKCELWEDSIFAHLTPGRDEIERQVLRLRDVHQECHYYDMIVVDKAVTTWARACNEEISKVRTKNQVIRQWNIFTSERLEQAGGIRTLTPQSKTILDKSEAIVDFLLANRASATLETVQEMADHFKGYMEQLERGLVDAANKKRNKNHANIDMPTHSRVECDGCQSFPIRGCRYNCAECSGDGSFDLCQACYLACDDTHVHHRFYKIDFPGSQPKSLSSRRNNSSSCYVHHGISCDKCQKAPIKGPRHKCVDCTNFDLCQMCYDIDGDHDETHLFLKSTHSKAVPTAMLPRFVTPTPGAVQAVQSLYLQSVEKNVDFRELYDYAVSD